MSVVTYNLWTKAVLNYGTRSLLPVGQQRYCRKNNNI